ncbi:MAG TPA: hypothetical protein VGZ04_11080, partial [Acidimicrobiales bacterium]|nr:hypothetical protein [Acidimicrobiales bacterium]
MSEDVGIPESTKRCRSSKPVFWWALIAAPIFLLGTMGSVLGGYGVANAQDKHNDQDFVTSSLDIASTLRLAIQHEQDLVDSTRSFLVGSPHAT